MKIDMRTLDDGTIFHVTNGNWDGYIFSKNDEKYMHIGHLDCKDVPLYGIEDLDIEIKGKYTHEKPDGTGHWTGGFDDEKWISIIMREFGVNKDVSQIMYSAMIKVYNTALERSKKI